MFYSPSNNTCFPAALRADYERNGNWPADAILISKELHKIVTNPPAGKIRVPGPDGLPMLVDKPGPTLDELKAAQNADLASACETAIAAIRAGYPESEVLSWPKQEAEARAFVADAGAVTPLLDALADARAVPKAELAARVIAKADAFAAISGALIGKRQALEDALNALPADATAEQVAAIVW